MQVFGNIATPLEKKTGKTSGRDYFVFRLAENHGKDENRTTTWYDVRAFISELDADLLDVKQFVKVTGRLDVQAYLKRDGTPAAAMVILASSIEPVETKKKSQPTGETAATPPAAREPAADAFAGMDDDFPPF